MKRTFSWFGVIALIIAIVAFFWLQRAPVPTPTGSNETPDVIQPQPKPSPEADMIQVALPIPNTQITSPLVVTGKARGGWYFEASFPIELRDSNNVVMVTTTGQAQSDWMTDSFVPFTATLTFPAQPLGSTGTLILKKDNPSGLPQNEASISIPVQF